MLVDLHSQNTHTKKKTEQKGVRENHSHIELAAVAFAPSPKTKVKTVFKGALGLSGDLEYRSVTIRLI